MCSVQKLFQILKTSKHPPTCRCGEEWCCTPSPPPPPPPLLLLQLRPRPWPTWWTSPCQRSDTSKSCGIKLTQTLAPQVVTTGGKKGKNGEKSFLLSDDDLQ